MKSAMSTLYSFLSSLKNVILDLRLGPQCVVYDPKNEDALVLNNSFFLTQTNLHFKTALLRKIYSTLPMRINPPL